ncbi:MAG: hypothetical protein FJZ15_07780, partial [Candidatus Omnitrophica bacterium]|nr:hypothetical protein [Candidatus Omnitrophota bacterium]
MKKTILYSALFVPFVYASGVWLLSVLSKTGFNDVVLYTYFPVYYSLPLLAELIKIVVLLCGLLLIIIFPGVLFAPAFMKNASQFGLTRFLSLSFVLNILLLFLGTAFIKLCGITLTRFWFIIVILAETLLGAALFLKNKILFVEEHSLRKHKGTIFCLALLVLATVIFIFFFRDPVLRPLPVEF